MRRRANERLSKPCHHLQAKQPSRRPSRVDRYPHPAIRALARHCAASKPCDLTFWPNAEAPQAALVLRDACDGLSRKCCSSPRLHCTKTSHWVSRPSYQYPNTSKTRCSLVPPLSAIPPRLGRCNPMMQMPHLPLTPPGGESPNHE